MVSKTVAAKKYGRMPLLMAGVALVALMACSDDNPKTRFFEIEEVSPPIQPMSMQLDDVYQTDVVVGNVYAHEAGFALTEGSIPPPNDPATVGRDPQMRGSLHYGATRQNKIPVAGALGASAGYGASMVQGHPVHGNAWPNRPHPDDVESTTTGQAFDPAGVSGGTVYGMPGEARDRAFAAPPMPAHGAMQGTLAAPMAGEGGVGTSLVDPMTGRGRDFRNVILNPQTMDPRNVNRAALDRLSAMSIRGYTMQATEGKIRPEAVANVSGMSGPRARPYWEMIADDIAEQMFSVKPPGHDFYYIEPANKYRNRAADDLFRDVLAKALRQRGVQVAPSPDYATAYVRIKVDSFNLNPLGFNGNVNPPDYTPIIRDSGHMMLVLDRGLSHARNHDLSPVVAEGTYADMVDVDPFVRPFTGIMVSGIIEQKHKSAYRVHGAYYIDRKDI